MQRTRAGCNVAAMTLLTGLHAEDLRASIARRLEAGGPAAWPLRAAARGWEVTSEQRIARPLALPTNARVVGVGSAVLGGAGKTPVAVALVRALAQRAGPAAGTVALVGHAYGANPRVPRVVGPADRVADVGDDAAAAAALLQGEAAVVVAQSRQAALDDAAARGHHVLVVDGLLQARPRRLDASILVLDAHAPWGGGACPPVGDLRARRDILMREADLFALVIGADEPTPPGAPGGSIRVEGRLRGARGPEGSAPPDAWSLEDLRTRRVGVILAIAHPERVLRALAKAGIHPTAQRLLADHAWPSPADLAFARAARVDVWVTTVRCATKLPRVLGGRPVLALDHQLDVRELTARVVSRALG